MSESSDKYQRAVAGMSAVVSQVPADTWSSASPCEEWTGRHLIGHVIAGFQMVSSVVGDTPHFDDPARLAGDDPAAAYAAARDRALGVLTEENLAKPVQSPIGQIPLDQQVAMFSTTDVLIHTWDLARCAGVDVTLDPGLVKETLEALLPLDEMIRAAGVFGPKLTPPDGADAQTELMCFVGRAP